MKSLRIIEDEHRAITAVIEGLRHLVAAIRDGSMAPDHGLLGALFHYIEAFPEKLHHPKEDDYLFARLRLRRPGAAPVLDALSREHTVGNERFHDLEAMWERFRADPGALDTFADGVERYAHFHWKHMRKEEDEVFPLAREALTAEDWTAIDAAFASNEDPVVGVPASKAFRELFRRIVAIAPPPWGVGPEAKPR
ncbi:MAG: hemerythrin domain-containing protein [Burkholderiales bacterium]|nr:hemerythrin domain-containing protein [Burkholderiales bacterium]MCE7878170.1 hemerythrin domain-containing protein [Betaproteobacteria bacterium PRO3]